jgi:hypothetical protein
VGVAARLPLQTGARADRTNDERFSDRPSSVERSLPRASATTLY